MSKRYNLLPAGVRGLVLTLPQKFRRRHGLEAGTAVEVTDEGDRLVVTPARAVEQDFQQTQESDDGTR